MPEVIEDGVSGIVVENYLLAQFNKSNPGKLKEAPFPKPLHVEYGSWAVQKGNNALVKRLNAFICKTQSSGKLATIYKVLDALTRLGVAREVSVISERKRYDANLDRHHHLVCTRCKKIVDFYDDGLDAIAPPRRLSAFVAHSVSVQVMGLCGRCAQDTPRSRQKGRRACN